MANTSSAKKALRSSARKRKHNLSKIEDFKSARKEVKDLVTAGKIKEAQTKLSEAYKKIDKAAKENIIHKNTAARYKSRLTHALNLASKKSK